MVLEQGVRKQSFRTYGIPLSRNISTVLLNFSASKVLLFRDRGLSGSLRPVWYMRLVSRYIRRGFVFCVMLLLL